MRPPRELTYRIEALPEVPPVLAFLVEQAGMDASAAYSTFNMGSGLAVYCSPGAGAAVVAQAERLGLKALLAGTVEKGPQARVSRPCRRCLHRRAARALRLTSPWGRALEFERVNGKFERVNGKAESLSPIPTCTPVRATQVGDSLQLERSATAI